MNREAHKGESRCLLHNKVYFPFGAPPLQFCYLHGYYSIHPASLISDAFIAIWYPSFGLPHDNIKYYITRINITLHCISHDEIICYYITYEWDYMFLTSRIPLLVAHPNAGQPHFQMITNGTIVKQILASVRIYT